MLRCLRLLALGATAFLVLVAAVPPSRAAASASVTGTVTGTFTDKFGLPVKYQFDVPAQWNGTLVLYSHGYVVPGAPNNAEDVGDPATKAFLIASGYALAGSSYSTTGWAIQQALPDQIQTLDLFTSTVGKPTRTIAWGHSLGGIITAGLIQQYPNRFDAALPMCGVLAGGVGTWNQALDSEFAFQQLVGKASPLQIVNIANPGANLGVAEALITTAQSTPAGRARLALSAALADTPGWFAAGTPQPAATDYAAQEQNQFLWLQNVDAPFVYAFRAELEARAGGNPSWNTGVDYEEQLQNSADRAEVKALYKAAHLDLEDDLKALNEAPRVAAKPSAVHYLTDNITFTGNIHIPVLTMHTTGDGLVVVQDEQAYHNVVDEAGNGALLRQTYVARAGHCSFTPAETITAFQTLVNRLDTGHWGSTSAALLDTRAAALGPNFNVFLVGSNVVATPPAFVTYRPSEFLRPFNRGHEGERGNG